MIKKLFRDSLVIGAIILLLGASIIPIINGNIGKKDISICLETVVNKNDIMNFPINTGWWPMFRNDVRRTGYTNEKGNVNGPYIKWKYETVGGLDVSPVIGDIDGDGQMEVVAAGSFINNRNVHAVDATNGVVEWVTWIYSSVPSSFAIGDVDGDGQMEIVFTLGYGVTALDGSNGQLEWRYSSGWPVDMSCSPAIWDVDGDGQMEVVCVGYKEVGQTIIMMILALDGTNGVIKWSYDTPEGTGNGYSSPAIADIDGDGQVEVVIGLVNHPGSGSVYALDGSNGQFEWSYTIGEGVRSTPAIGDIDGDGQVEVVIGSGFYQDPPMGNVYALDGSNGQFEWSYTTGDEVFSSPAIGDIDGDGDMEVVIGSRDHNVYALDGTNGQFEWSYTTGDEIWSSPALGDIDGDGQMEIVIGSSDTYVYVLDGSNGAVEWSYATGAPVDASPALGDIDGDGLIEVIVSSHEDGVYCNMYAFDDVLEISIDIKPGSFPNSINPNSNGKVPVAILSTDDFDASLVDPGSVDFLSASPLMWAMEDVDGDGDIDMILHFKIRELDFNLLVDEGEKYPYAYLNGETNDGIPIVGKDTVRLVCEGQISPEVLNRITSNALIKRFFQNNRNVVSVLQKLLNRLGQ